MNQRTGRARRGVAALGTLVLTALAVLTGLGVPAAATVDPLVDVEVRITAVSPQVLRPGEELTVRAELHNAGDAAVAEPAVSLHLDTGSFISRSSLDRWRAPGLEGRTGPARITQTSTEPLPPGGTRTVTLTLPAAETGLGTAWRSWGAHGIAVTVVDRADPARSRLAVARTFMLWFPPDEVTPTRVSVLVPVVGGRLDPHGTTTAEELDRLTAPDGRLTAVLEATREHRDVTWLVDPALVELGATPTTPPAGGTRDDGTADGAAEGGSQDGGAEGEGAQDQGTDDGGADGATDEPGDEPTDEPTDDAGSDGAGTGGEAAGGAPDDGDGDTGDGEGTAGAGTQEWVADLLRASVGRDVPLLPWGDADVSALAHLDEPDVLRLAQERSSTVAASTDLPDTAATALVLPAEDLPDRTTAAFAQTGGEHAVVVAPGELLPPGALTYTPSGRTTVRTGARPVTVLVPDERLSRALDEGGFRPPADDAAPAEPVAATTPATAAQDVLAELAVITRERPSDGRHLLVTVPRDWHPDAGIASAQIEALITSPWVRPEPVAALVGAPDPGVDRGTLPERSPLDEDAISGAQLDALEKTLATRVSLAEMAESPAALLGAPDEELLAAVSTAWRADPAGRRELVDRSTAVTNQLRQAVRVRTGSRINLISTTGELPVVVENTLDQPVEVEVVLQPRDVRLRIDDHPTVTLAGGETQTVHVPVHAIQSGTVPITVELRTTDGAVIDDSADMRVLVRAEWEGIGTAVLGALLAVGVLISVVRTIRRGRTPRRAEPVAAGPDALSPEEAGR